MTRNRLKLDERNVQIVHLVLSVAQTVTTFLLIAIFIRRLHVLEQTFDENWDIGLLIILNGALLAGGLLYLGGVNVPKISLKGVVTAYVTFTLAVLLFKLLVDVVIQGQPFSIPGLLSQEMLVMAVACAAITGVFTAIVYLGQRRLEKNLK